MTLNELQKKVRYSICISGSFQITIEYRGKELRCTSNNTMAYDRLHCNDTPSHIVDGWYTEKGAYQAMWDECVRAHFDR